MRACIYGVCRRIGLTKCPPRSRLLGIPTRKRRNEEGMPCSGENPIVTRSALNFKNPSSDLSIFGTQTSGDLSSLTPPPPPHLSLSHIFFTLCKYEYRKMSSLGPRQYELLPRNKRRIIVKDNVSLLHFKNCDNRLSG